MFMLQIKISSKNDSFPAILSLRLEEVMQGSSDKRKWHLWTLNQPCKRQNIGIYLIKIHSCTLFRNNKLL